MLTENNDTVSLSLLRRHDPSRHSPNDTRSSEFAHPAPTVANDEAPPIHRRTLRRLVSTEVGREFSDELEDDRENEREAARERRRDKMMMARFILFGCGWLVMLLGFLEGMKCREARWSMADVTKDTKFLCEVTYSTKDTHFGLCEDSKIQAGMSQYSSMMLLCIPLSNKKPALQWQNKVDPDGDWQSHLDSAGRWGLCIIFFSFLVVSFSIGIHSKINIVHKQGMIWWMINTKTDAWNWLQCGKMQAGPSFGTIQL